MSRRDSSSQPWVSTHGHRIRNGFAATRRFKTQCGSVSLTRRITTDSRSSPVIFHVTAEKKLKANMMFQRGKFRLAEDGQSIQAWRRKWLKNARNSARLHA